LGTTRFSRWPLKLKLKLNYLRQLSASSPLHPPTFPCNVAWLHVQVLSYPAGSNYAAGYRCLRPLVDKPRQSCPLMTNWECRRNPTNFHSAASRWTLTCDTGHNSDWISVIRIKWVMSGIFYENFLIWEEFNRYNSRL